VTLPSLLCRWLGHDYEEWSPYSRGHYDGPMWMWRSTLWLVEVGQQRRCQRCGEQWYRGVFFDEPHPTPMESREEQP
jgi:hypothetical protein